MRYSHKPIEDYKAVINGRTYGPASSAILCEPEAWNLAFLSHDFDACFTHSDPYFSTNVRRTVQSKLDGTGPDLVGEYPPTALVQSLLNLSAPRFVYLIRRSPVLETLPMYLAYGPTWVDLIDQRARLVVTDPHQYEPVENTKFAQEYLFNLTRR